MATSRIFSVIFDTVFENGKYTSTAKLYSDYWETTCEKVPSATGWGVIEKLGFKPVHRGNYTSWRNPNVTASNQ